MPLENVNIPQTLNVVDPQAAQEKKNGGVTYWEQQAKETRAQREFVQEQKLINDLNSPPSAPEPPFKVTGGINLGNIDIQEQQRVAREDSARLQKEAQERVEKAEREVAATRDALNAANLNHLRDTLSGQIAALQNALQAGNRGDISTELETIEKVAAKLGLARPTGNVGGDSFNHELALLKLQQEMKREDRKFALETKKEEKLWTLELKKLEQQQKESEARLLAEQNKYSLFASLPEQVGGVIVKAMAAQEGGVSSRPGNKQAPVRDIEAHEGEAGQIGCPICGNPVGIAPTTQATRCAGCGQQFRIKRIPAELVSADAPTANKEGDEESVRNV